jgi:hypothetical protein
MKKFVLYFTAVPLGAGLLFAQSSTNADKTQDSQRMTSQSWSGTLVAADCHDTGGLASSDRTKMDSRAASKSSDMTADRSRDRNSTYEQRTNPTTESTTSTTVATDRTTADKSKVDDAKNPTQPTTTTDTTGTADRTRDRSTTESNPANPANPADKARDRSTTAESNPANPANPANPPNPANPARDRSTTYEQRTDESIAKTNVDPTRNPSDQTTDASANAGASSKMDHGKMTAKNMDDSCRISSTTTTFALRLKDGSIVRFDDASNAKIAQQLQSGNRLKDKSKLFHTKVKGSMNGDVITIESIQI